jgi:hypothetical protein
LEIARQPVRNSRGKFKVTGAGKVMRAYVAAMTNEHEPGVAYYAFAKSVDEAEPMSWLRSIGIRRPMPRTWNRLGQGVASQIHASDRGKPHIMQYVSPGTEPAVRRLKEN